MMRHILFVVLLIGGMYYYWDTREVTHGPGVVAPEPPIQKSLSEDEITFKNFTLIPQASITLEGRILSIKKYYFDPFSELTKTDIVFSWKAMSDERNLNSLMVRQEDRSFYWEMTKPPINKQDMWKQAANMHLIGPTAEMRDKINSLRKGQVVKIEGYLVNAESSEGWTLQTSLSRNDIGDGASELVWINKMNIL